MVFRSFFSVIWFSIYSVLWILHIYWTSSVSSFLQKNWNHRRRNSLHLIFARNNLPRKWISHYFVVGFYFEVVKVNKSNEMICPQSKPISKECIFGRKKFVQNLRFTILVCCDGVGGLAVIFLLLFSCQLSFVELAQDFVVELKKKLVTSCL